MRRVLRLTKQIGLKKKRTLVSIIYIIKSKICFYQIILKSIVMINIYSDHYTSQQIDQYHYSNFLTTFDPNLYSEIHSKSSFNTFESLNTFFENQISTSPKIKLQKQFSINIFEQVEKFSQIFKQNDKNNKNTYQQIDTIKVDQKEKNHIQNTLNDKQIKSSCLGNKNLTKNWIKRIKEIIKYQLQISVQGYFLVKKIYQKLEKCPYTLKFLGKLIAQNPYMGQLFEKKYFKNKQLERLITNHKRLNYKTKVQMIQSIDGLKYGFRNPHDFYSWKLANKNKKRDCSDLILRYPNLQQNQILQDIINKLQDVQKQSEFMHEQGCQQERQKSQNNNLTYLWKKILRGSINSIQQKYIEDMSDYVECKSILNDSITTIQALRKVLNNTWFKNYILQNKIKNKQIIQEILIDKSINLKSKKKLLESYSSFMQALRSPHQFKRWSLRIHTKS